ncbi:GAP family protein [Aeromicrobium sp. Leaf350]|uniref:GAP family protein n=1 Tax=Aeromicrobium sp. Leaf350 TaxID=2876565 RepID=UPI001E2F4A5A|nr:GAP family protein [Aeromicrobium sp. Leaf350]
MGVTTLAVLVGLALVDSTSIGTLVIPLVWLLRPGPVAWRPLLTFLATVAAMYAAIGVVLLLVGESLTPVLADVGDLEALRGVQLGIGLVLLASSFSSAVVGRFSGRALLWRDRLRDGEGAGRSIAGTATVAVAVEVPTMLPYLAAIGILAASDLALAAQVGLVGGYAVVMILPALVLAGARAAASSRVEAPLRRLDDWLTRQAEEMTGWVFGLVGFFVAADAAQALGLFGS